MNSSIFPACTPIVPRDEREEALVAQHQRDLAEQWRVVVGPLIRRSGDGRLIRLPDRQYGNTFDAQVACDRYVLGHGPGRSHGVIEWWIAIAKEFKSWPLERRAWAEATAVRNELIHRQSLRTNPPAPVRGRGLVLTPAQA